MNEGKMSFPKWCNEKVTFELDKLEVLAIVGNIVLSLRHPKNRGASSDIAKTVGKRLAKAIANDGMVPEDVKAEWRSEGLL